MSRLRETAPYLIAFLLLLVLAGSVQGATTTKIDLDSRGDAEWTVETRVNLDTESKVSAFQVMAGNVSQINSTRNFKQRLEATVQKANSRTDRQMEISRFSAEAEVQGLTQKWGVVRYTFDWSNFADAENGNVTLQESISGYYLAQEDVLRITVPAGAEILDIRPTPDKTGDSSVTWQGPISFGEGEPFLSFSTSSQNPATDSGEGTSGEAGRDQASSGDGGTNPLALLLVLALLLIIGGAAYSKYGEDLDLDELRDLFGSTGGSSPGGQKVSTEGLGDQPMPDEDLVVELLKEAGGRLRQAEVVERTGWSEAKVSNVTNSLKNDERILKRRWGRENVLILSDEEKERLGMETEE